MKGVLPVQLELDSFLVATLLNGNFGTAELQFLWPGR